MQFVFVKLLLWVGAFTETMMAAVNLMRVVRRRSQDGGGGDGGGIVGLIVSAVACVG